MPRPEMNDALLTVEDLKKSFGPVQAVRGISFQAQRGKLMAFLGPNGAGKSTTIAMLCTLLLPDGGMVKLDGLTLGRDDAAIRSHIGVVFQEGLLDPLLTVKENLVLRGRFYPMNSDVLQAALENAARSTDILGFWDRPYGKLSGGQRRRADIARALLHTPKLLFLDEPTTGLDPQTRRAIWDTVRNLQRDNQVTVFMTTHYMEEAAEADHVIVIDDGTIVASGTPDELRQKYGSDILKLRTTDTPFVRALLTRLGLSFQEIGDLFTIPLKRTLDALEILDACRETLINVELRNGTMDDAFLNITGKEIRQ